MQNRYSYLVKNTGILAISNFSSKILAFLLVPLYTRVLTTEEYGNYDFVSTTIQLLIPILTISICDAVVRYLMEEGISHKHVITVGMRFCLIGVVLFTIFILVNRLFGEVYALSEYACMSILLFFSTVFYQFTTSAAKGMEKISMIAVAGVMSTLVMISTNIVFLLYLKMGIIGFFSAGILSQFIPAIFLFFRLELTKYNQAKINKDVRNVMIKYSMPLILNTVGWWMNNALDRYAVTFICGAAANGVFSVAYKIPTILATVQQIFIQAWQITAIKEYSKDSGAFYGKMMNFINMTMGMTCMALVLMTKLLAGFLYANDFYQAWQYVPFLLVSGVMNSASGILGPILCADENSRALGVSTFFGASINVVLNILFVYAIGPQGATIATLISSFAIYEFRSRALVGKITYERKHVMGLSWLLLIVQAIVMIYLENYLLQLVIICVYLFLYHRDIKKLILSTVNYLKNR